MVIPRGYHYLEDDPHLEAPANLSNITGHEAETIGCPITLLPKRMHKLWGWFIDDIERTNLWEMA